MFSSAPGSTLSMIPTLSNPSSSSTSLDTTSSTSSRGAFPNLTTLKISSVECAPAAFRQLVRGLPNLTSVKLDARDADPAVLGTMAESDSEDDTEAGSGSGSRGRGSGIRGGGRGRIPFPLIGEKKTERICPQLRTVTCTGVPGGVIRDFVARRERARVPIRTVRVCVASEAEERAWAPEDGGDENEGWADARARAGSWLSPVDRAWLEKHVELEFFDEDEEDVDGGAWWSTWD